MGSPALRGALAALVTAGLLLVGLAAAPAPGPGAVLDAGSAGLVAAADLSPHRRDGLREALAVLRRWDTRREQAWRNRDAEALAVLYVPGSEAARSDLRLLRSYTSRGLVVRRMQTQLLAIEVLRRSPTAIRVRVLDRVAGGEVTAGDRRMSLRGTRPVAHTIDLRRVGGRWRVGSVSASGADPRAAPPPRRGR